MKAFFGWMVLLALLAAILMSLPEAIDKELEFQDRVYKREAKWTQ